MVDVSYLHIGARSKKYGRRSQDSLPQSFRRDQEASTDVTYWAQFDWRVRQYIAWRKHSKDSTRFLGCRRWEKRPRLDQLFKLSLEVNDEISDYTYFCLISRWKK